MLPTSFVIPTPATFSPLKGAVMTLSTFILAARIEGIIVWRLKGFAAEFGLFFTVRYAIAQSLKVTSAVMITVGAGMHSIISDFASGTLRTVDSSTDLIAYTEVL